MKINGQVAKPPNTPLGPLILGQQTFSDHYGNILFQIRWLTTAFSTFDGGPQTFTTNWVAENNPNPESVAAHMYRLSVLAMLAPVGWIFPTKLCLLTCIRMVWIWVGVYFSRCATTWQNQLSETFRHMLMLLKVSILPSNIQHRLKI